MTKKEVTYASSGVNIGAADEAVNRIKEKVRSTFRSEVLGELGTFGGMFSFDPTRYKDPILVSGTDGVGTKSVIATMMRKYDTIGIDLVATCVDDLVCQGAETLFFLDYISVGKLDPDMAEELVSGVAEGCRTAGAALIGGEMSEHGALMEVGEFDFVGFAVGVVERDRVITPKLVKKGDVVIGIPSPGIRCNGYSLARKVFFEIAKRGLDEPAWKGANHSLGEELLRPSVVYAPAILELMKQVDVHGCAHITGGGIPGNLARVLPEKLDAVINPQSWERPEVFDEIQTIGNISEDEMRNVFNLGIGMALVVSVDDEHKVIDHLRLQGHRAHRIGEIVAGSGQVKFAAP
jgi:phosphoribosylformylglycinamidine cyclo-ligase